MNDQDWCDHCECECEYCECDCEYCSCDCEHCNDCSDCGCNEGIAQG